MRWAWGALLSSPPMALLRSDKGGREQRVTARLLVGRSPACALRLDDVHASGEHATVTWTGWHWEVKDLGSRNGTFVDGSRLEPGVAVKLSQGSKLAFGDPSSAWEVTEDDPPNVMCVHQQTQAIREAEGDFLTVPDDENPEVTIFQDATGKWQSENQDGELEDIEDQAVIKTSTGDWQVQLPSVNEGTPLMQIRLALETLHARFAVSRDEERVEITLVNRGLEIPLEPREHGYVLLTLARARQEDQALPPEARGWRDRDQLEKMLAMDSNALNVAIHRARQQFSRAGVSGAAGIVEVRRKQRRLGTDRFQIQPLE